MKREEVLLFIEVGGEYKFFENGCNTVGKVIKVSDTALILQRQDGTKKIVSFDVIQGIDECAEEERGLIEQKSEKESCIERNAIEHAEKSDYNMETSVYSCDSEEIELTAYLSSIIDSVDLDKYQEQGMISVNSIINGRYIGDGKRATEEIIRINERFMQKDREKFEGNSILLSARIAYDSLAHSTTEKLSKEYIYSMLGKALIEKADYTISESKGIDSAISYYIEALKVLPQSEKKSINKALNMMVYAFFADSQSLQKEISNQEVMEQINLEKYYYQVIKAQNNIREFVIATFMLYNEKPNYVAIVKKSILDNELLMDYVLTEFARIQEIDKGKLDEDFDDAWKGAYDEYVEKMAELKDTFWSCATQWELEDQLREYRLKIEDIRNKDFLSGNDDDNVGEFIDTIEDLGEARKKTNYTEKIGCYRDLHRRIEGRLKKLVTSPSEWSYTALRAPNKELLQRVSKEIITLCNTSKPEISMEIQKNEILVNEKAVTVEIEVKNMQQKQRADAVDIEVTCIDSEIRIQELNRCGAIESGGQESYYAKYQLTDNILKRGSFKINIRLKYKYFVNFMTLQEEEINQTFTIKFINKPFEHIDNMYAKIVYGTGLKDYPEMFKGRNELINKLCASMDLGNGKMNTNRGIVLWGQRRVGKNSVKDNFKEQLKIQYPQAYIHIDIGSIGKLQNSFKNLLLMIARSTENEIKRNHPELFEYYKLAGLCEMNKQIKNDENYVVAFGEYMTELMQMISENSQPYTNIPLYYIDEFTYCYGWIMEGKVDGKEFMQFIKSFISDYGICAILLAQDNMPVWKAEYPNEFNCMDFDNMISFLDKKGTAELVCEPCPINGKSRFMPDAVEYIYNLTRGSAFLIDILCDQIIEYLNENKNEEYVKKYTVENVLNSWICGEKDFFEETVFEAQYQDTSKVGEEAKLVEQYNKELLMEISENTREREFANISDLEFFEKYDKKFATDIFERLVKRKIIVVEGENCKLYMPLLKFMFLKKKGLLDVDSLEYIE